MRVVLFAILICHLPNLLPAQQQADSDFNKKVILPIEARWQQPGGDTAIYFLLQQVRNFCKSDGNCQFQAYNDIMFKLERLFNLPAAIMIGEEMLKVARAQKNLHREAGTYVDLSRFHMALGNRKMAFINAENALRFYEQLDDQSEIINTKILLLEYSLSYRKLEGVMSEMEALLKQAIAQNDSANTMRLHVKLVQYAEDAGLYNKMEEHVAALEKIQFPNPLRPKDYGIAIHTALGRAKLFRYRNKLVEAERYFQKTLRLCEAEPSRWLEIYVLQALSDLEWDRGNKSLAKSYLDKAQQKAEALKLNDLLASVFERKSKIAEAEGRFADALEFNKKHEFHKEAFSARSAGFNMENYYLQKEKDHLATEKKKQELELLINQAKLRNSLIITALIILLMIGLLIGWHHQRKGKHALAAQNAIILQQTEKLKSLDDAKSRFFANVSHELRTPLTLMLGPIKSLLKGKYSPEQQEKLLKIANHNGQQLQQLVNEILDLRKMEVGKMELNERPTKLASFFNRHSSMFDSLAAGKHIEFLHETSIEKGVSAHIDQEKCRQVLHNLLSNAFKFTPAGGQVKANFSLVGKTLVLEVSDTGVGIHPDDLPHVFDPYFQTSRPEKSAEGGTGIGLALCHEYVQLFGGKIEVQSTLGKGSVFRAAFPVTLIENAAPLEEDMEITPFMLSMEKPVEPAQTQSSNGAKPTILVVEDNLELQEYIRFILEEKYQIITAGNGREALNCLLSATNCQLILSDLMMPVMDGYELLEKLKSGDATRHIPFIMLTARAEKDDRLRALRIGVDDYLTKPFDEEELKVRIKNLLAHQDVRKTAMAEEMVNGKDVIPIRSQEEEAWLEELETFVRKNMSNNALSVSWLAHEFAMSESTLLRQLKRLTGLSPQKYLLEMRLNEARKLLEERTMDSITKVAVAIGYPDARSFSRSFKGRFGKLPSEMLNN